MLVATKSRDASSSAWRTNLPVAFFGPAARTTATLAAMLFARALAKRGATRLVRARLLSDPPLPREEANPDGLTVLDLDAADGPQALDRVLSYIDDGNPLAGRLVLDLPPSVVEDARLRTRIAVAVLVVGDGPLDEAAAADAYARAARVQPPAGSTSAPVWLLGCDRHGGTQAALAFASDMAVLARARTGEPVRALPCVLPPLSHTQAGWLLLDVQDESWRVLAEGLAVVIDAARRIPNATELPAPPDCALDRDGRTPDRLLRDLADDLGLLDYGAPPEDVLRHAPLLEDWSYGERPRRVLEGVVVRSLGGPARRIATTECFASDGRTWARCLDGWYRLKGSRAA